MRIERAISRREFLAITATAVAGGLLKPSALAYAEECGEAFDLDRVLFDYSFEWDKDDRMVPPQTFEEYAAILDIEIGETVRLEPFDEGRLFRSESVYPCCKLVSEGRCSWHGLLDDELDLDMRALKILEVGYPIYAHVESWEVMDIECWPNSQQLVTLKLNVFALLRE